MNISQQDNPNYPKVFGKLRKNIFLSKSTWFQVGGIADIVFKPANENDLINFIKKKPDNLSVTIIGAGSNILVRDGGIRGVVIRLGRYFNNITVKNSDIYVGASVFDWQVSQIAQKYSIAGFEFLNGIPGTIGGAIRMNAGAYGYEMKDILHVVNAISPEGKHYTLTSDEFTMNYRKCSIPKDWIFTSAILRGKIGNTTQIARIIAKLHNKRFKTQPIKSHTGGSTFKNVFPHRAWEIIDSANCRGLTIGQAKISEHHCNFMINMGSATALDFERLGEEVRKRVKENCGINLQWEIERIGEYLSPIVYDKS